MKIQYRHKHCWHYYIQWWFFMPAVLHFKKWKKNINFLTFQRIALCPSLHSKCAKNSIDRIFINNSSLRQNNILSDCYPVLFQYLCIVLQNLGKKKKKKKKESPCFMKCRRWCYQSLYCVKQVDFTSWRKPMAHKLSRGEWVMTVFQIR